METKEQLEIYGNKLLETAERDLTEKQALNVLVKTYGKLETLIKNREYLSTAYGNSGWYVNVSDVISVMSYLKGAYDVLIGE